MAAKKSALKMCWQRQIWDNTEFEKLCALEDDQKMSLRLLLESKDQMHCTHSTLCFHLNLQTCVNDNVTPPWLYFMEKLHIAFC